MNARLQFIGQNRVDRPVLGDPALALQSLGCNSHPEMALARWVRPNMAMMLVRLVNHLQKRRGKTGAQLGLDICANWPHMNFNPFNPFG